LQPGGIVRHRTNAVEETMPEQQGLRLPERRCSSAVDLKFVRRLPEMIRIPDSEPRRTMQLD
jgi:hypothetical protein